MQMQLLYHYSLSVANVSESSARLLLFGVQQYACRARRASKRRYIQEQSPMKPCQNINVGLETDCHLRRISEGQGTCQETLIALICWVHGMMRRSWYYSLQTQALV